MKASRSLKDYFLFAEAWLLLAVARLMLVFLPFRKIMPLLGKPGSNTTFEPQNDNLTLSAIKLAIMRGCGYSPWRTKCFEQALAAKMMLKRRGFISTVSFGVYKDNDSNKLNAHAWLQCGQQVLTGGNNLERYTVLSSFTG
jgi:hypothetical protein